ncbi:siderophore-interacting protein [Corynebacterium diphtheriae]|uniref:siderophore-interacting protein n=1 Tax=Corynebacterium diphtheriae TaxID=1717 RepID=UPI000A1F7BAD|nr:siderophore-interacting protein [Corynebacterium diphtheriae]OSQ21529.1 NADPH-dependent ferric siderophore reductase [Corynebacterium diphtheriae]RKX00279.1 siderophore-interacting protein [Corynebacterium diphtheriae]CAB0574188.1 siderophore-interacting protein [Corynebacterium diphtheriae]CAB0576215.1 siderophore-interacting protein [Corynebacterium diphtheriae]CAB0666230.1 siderophore-interacting protein [Corynebacterium diphtheriae]
MAHRPYRVRVARAQQISPHFQRVTLHGVENVGPKDIIRDVRIKVIIPTSGQLPDLPEENWFTTWKDLDPETRGRARTYSIRAFRRNLPNNAPDELDIDFVLHPDAAGPASTWATNAEVGDELLIIAPSRDDDSGGGIEFVPDASSRVVMLGDETALPAIAKTLEEWPEDVRGDVFIEIPCLDDAQELEVPPGVTVQWLAREVDEADRQLSESLRRKAAANGDGDGRGASGELLYTSLEKFVRNELQVDSQEPLSDVGAEQMAEDAASASEYDPSLMVWETPSFSRAGEALDTSHSESPFKGTYFWIAGESSAVIRMRRLLVKEHQVPRKQVSFMGYWKRGQAAKG